MKVTESTPDLNGAHGKAWRCNVASMAKDCGQDKAETCLGNWIILAAWAHPLWSCYALSLIHLRPVEGMPPAKIMLPGATHEIYLYALDPDHTPEIDKAFHLLHPINFGGQWVSPSDAEAVRYVEGVIQEICDGNLSPDTDFRREWIKRFSASNMMRRGNS